MHRERGDHMNATQLCGHSTSEKRPIEKLAVVRNFQQVIAQRDINHMKRELYQFLNLHCGFIAHYDINGFKSVYSRPQDFARVFIRHFDKEHIYFSRIYDYHREQMYAPNRSSMSVGYTLAQIKEEFYRIVEPHKAAIMEWAEKHQRNERYAIYLALKEEFEGGIMVKQRHARLANHSLQSKPTKKKRCQNECKTT